MLGANGVAAEIGPSRSSRMILEMILEMARSLKAVTAAVDGGVADGWELCVFVFALDFCSLPRKKEGSLQLGLVPRRANTVRLPLFRHR